MAVAVVCATASGWAQRVKTYHYEDLPSVPLDTLDTDREDVKVIVYANNTFRYYYPSYSKLVANPVYKEHWTTTNVFAYTDVKLADLPETMEVQLIRSLDDFHVPVMGRVTSRYGPRGRGQHKGIDIALPTGEPIYATFEGKVRYARWNSGGYGYLVIIRHPNGLETYYGHLCKLNVSANDYVCAGQVIGYGGNTGRSRGAHLHFEMRYADLTFDPERIIDFSTGELKYHTYVLERGYFNVSSKMTEALEEYDDMDSVLTGSDGEPLTSEQIVAGLEAEAAKAKPTVNDAIYYKVRSGDNLYKIASKYGTSVSAICRLNGIKSTSTLRIGQSLRVR